MNEILQQRIKSIHMGKDLTYIKKVAERSLREQLEIDMAEFLACGGTVKEIPKGQSSVSTKGWNGSEKSKAQQTMRQVMSNSISEANARRENPNVIARNKALMNGEKRFCGATCSKCGGVSRYTSTNSCIACNKASSALNHKKRMGVVV